jgi:hypothetical protein
MHLQNGNSPYGRMFAQLPLSVLKFKKLVLDDFVDLNVGSLFAVILLWMDGYL